MITSKFRSRSLALVLSIVLGATFISLPVSADSPTKVAFIGDQGVGENALAVLQLIKSENTQLLLIQGDFGYDDSTADIWESQLNATLGENFPVVGVVGNHENYEWPAYKNYLADRIDRVDGLECSGDTGVKALCRYGDIDIVQVAPGIFSVEDVLPEDGYPEYITEQLNSSDATWRICSWHKNQTMMQVGAKGNETGWGVYQACLEQGAIVATGHEHSYSRTFLMSDFENQVVAHKNDIMEIGPGQSIAFVSGLGGREVRGQVRTDDWWASIYTASQQASPGALFCTLDGNQADCYFKDISGAVPDTFSLVSAHSAGSTDAGDTSGGLDSGSSPESDANSATSTSSGGSSGFGGIGIAAIVLLLAFGWVRSLKFRKPS